MYIVCHLWWVAVLVIYKHALLLPELFAVRPNHSEPLQVNGRFRVCFVEPGFRQTNQTRLIIQQILHIRILCTLPSMMDASGCRKGFLLRRICTPPLLLHFLVLVVPCSRQTATDDKSSFGMRSEVSLRLSNAACVYIIWGCGSQAEIPFSDYISTRQAIKTKSKAAKPVLIE
jgi:hypothetical protein